MSLRHEDFCTLLRNGGDERDILTRKLFNVNMRLFRDNLQYRDLVLRCATYIRECAMTTREGYKKPHGYSGANAGIPWNIIALADGQTLINPVVIEAGPERVESESNCGSLLLEAPIWIWRYRRVVVDYYNMSGVKCQLEGYVPTIQHEIDHNNGVLITDRKV